MNTLTGTWLAADFMLGKPDSAKFIKFKDDNTYIINDGLDQVESTYELDEDQVRLEPALGIGALNYHYSVQKKDNSEILTLSVPEGFVFSFVKKVE